MTPGLLSPRRALLGLLLLAVVSPGLAQGPPGQGVLKQLPPEVARQVTARSYGQQTDAFRRLLFELHFQPVANFEELRTNPSESLLVVLGNPSCLSRQHFPKGLVDFVNQGGAILIATDLATNGEAGGYLNQLAGVTVAEEKLVCRSHNEGERDLYEGSEHCPFLQPSRDAWAKQESRNAVGMLAAALGTGSQPNLFRNPHPERGDTLRRVATNAPSHLNIDGWWLPGSIVRLAKLPRACMDVDAISKPGIIEFNGRGEPRIQPKAYDNPLFAVGGTVGNGRVLVLADHSLFINRMMLPRDNDNLEFAANCLHWLRGGVSTPMEALRAAQGPDASRQLLGQRSRVLLWDDGVIRTKFEVPLKAVPLKPSFVSEPTIVAALDKTLTRLEENDFFNRQILDSINSMPGGQKRVVRYALYLLTLAALLLLGYRYLWRSWYRPEGTLPTLAETVRQQQPRLSLLDQRRQALVRSGNVWEIVHRLARDSFESAGVSLATRTPPRVEMTGGNRWQRWRVNRRVARLWKLARGDTPLLIPPLALQRWLRELEKLKSLLRDETIHLT